MDYGTICSIQSSLMGHLRKFFHTCAYFFYSFIKRTIVKKIICEYEHSLVKVVFNGGILFKLTFLCYHTILCDIFLKDRFGKASCHSCQEVAQQQVGWPNKQVLMRHELNVIINV